MSGKPEQKKTLHEHEKKPNFSLSKNKKIGCYLSN